MLSAYSRLEYRALVINRKSMEEGADQSFNYLLPLVSHMNFYFMSSVSVGCLFIAKEWLEYNIFNCNLFLRRQQGPRTNIET
jgi:hypothetical protein